MGFAFLGNMYQLSRDNGVFIAASDAPSPDFPFAMKYYYADSSNQTAGPVSLDQIRLLAGSGQIPADPMVTPEGGQEWRPLSTIASIAPVPPQPSGSRPPMPPGAAAASPGKALKINATMPGDLVAGVLATVSKILSPERINGWLKAARDYGQYAVFAGMALTLVYALYAAIRTNEFRLFGAGVGLVLALMVGQFAAGRFLGAGDKLIENTPSRLSSGAFLECVGLLALLFAAGTILAGLAACVAMRSAAPLVPALVVALLWGTKGGIALHPRMVGVAQEGGGSAGEEAVGLLLFFLKAGLKVVPLAFALLAAAGCVLILLSFFMESPSFWAGIAVVPGMEGPSLLLAACLLPLAAYFLFLLASLLLDVIRAILIIPGKLDSLRK